MNVLDKKCTNRGRRAPPNGSPRNAPRWGIRVSPCAKGVFSSGPPFALQHRLNQPDRKFPSVPSPLRRNAATDGTVRAHYQAFSDWLDRTTPARIAQKRDEAERAFHRVGITFAVYGEDSGTERLIPFDIVPRIIPADEWKMLERGLKQRVQALNAFLHDIYHDQKILAAGVMPRERVLGNTQYRREMQGMDVPVGIYAHIAGVDIVRAGEGECYVLEDNLRVPSGVSYMLENRKMMMRLFPELFATQSIRPVQHYPDLLLENLHVAGAGRRGGADRRGADARRVQLRVFRARVPRAADGRRAGRGPGPLRPERHRLHAHDARPEARARDLPPGRRRLPRSARVPAGLDARRAGAVRRVPRRPRDARQRDRHRRRRRQVDLPVRAGHDPLLPRRRAGAEQRADLPRLRRQRMQPRARAPRRAGGEGGARRRRLRHAGRAGRTAAERDEFRERILAHPEKYIAQPTLALSTCPTFVERARAAPHRPAAVRAVGQR